MTPRQRDAMLFIQRYVAENGRSPTYAEILTGIHTRSKGCIHRIIQCLTEQGYLSSEKGKERSIKILHPIIEGHFFIFDDETKSLKPIIREVYTPPKLPKEPPKKSGWTNYAPSKKSILRGARKGAEAKRARRALVTLASVSLLKTAGAR